MRYALLLTTGLLVSLGANGQNGACSCGAAPPVKVQRQLEPYANAPSDLRPFSKFAQPYFEHYTKTPDYNGAAADAVPVPANAVSEVAIGFLGPIQDHPDVALGQAMLRGARMAIDEANARGGYCGKPFRLKIHNDGLTWGSSSNELVKMVYDDKVWGMLGSISGDSTHIALRVSLRAELPMVNSASTDPTIPETIIPWLLTTIQDDRVQSYTLARRIYTEAGMKRIALLRVNDRYGRFGVGKFKDASRRLGHPVIIEQKFLPGATDFSRELRVIKDSRVDGIVLWADSPAAGMILKQMRALGMTQRVFGAARVVGEHLLPVAGTAAEGLEVVYPFDPTRDDPIWLEFNKRYTAAYGEQVDSFSALGFDSMNILVESICRAGLSRGRIRDALYAIERYRGVTGEMIFDPNAKNIASLYLGVVKDGRLAFRRYPMDSPYAALKDGRAGYVGPSLRDTVRSTPVVGLFGPGADKLSSSLPQRDLRVVGIASETAWGKSSTALVNLIYQPDLIGLIATDRAAAHLAGQVAAKTLVPIIALSTDRTLTAANTPWIFRLSGEGALGKALNYFEDAARRIGPNRGRIREYLASGMLPQD